MGGEGHLYDREVLVSKQLIEAVFEHGVLRPLIEIVPPIPEGQQVRLLVEADEPLPYALELATSVYDGLTEQEVEVIERIALDRNRFFDPRGGP
jgi:predicted DNA-binding antitoxin AbrB/MazE fold protein